MHVRVFVLASLCFFALMVPVGAHHSHANYDNTAWRTVEGTVKQVHWVFPHAWVYVDVKDEKGQVETVALEGANPNAIREAGVKKEDLRPGDRVRSRCHPRRDATIGGCLLGFVTPIHGDAARGHGVEKAWN